jgi:hypothetical protein
MKARILQRLGQSEVLLPARIAEGLAANDRAKVRMSALQAAATRAANPAAARDDFAAECATSGVNAAEIGAMVATAHGSDPDGIAASGLAAQITALFRDIGTMIDAVAAADSQSGAEATKRLSALKSRIPLERDAIEAARIAELSALPADGSDTAHRLVMDLHKALNRLAAACAEEDIAGARAYGLTAGDRPVIEASMRGLARKFDHPGLDTTVMRSGSRLVIQNDKPRNRIDRAGETSACGPVKSWGRYR